MGDRERECGNCGAAYQWMAHPAPDDGINDGGIEEGCEELEQDAGPAPWEVES